MRTCQATKLTSHTGGTKSLSLCTQGIPTGRIERIKQMNERQLSQQFTFGSPTGGAARDGKHGSEQRGSSGGVVRKHRLQAAAHLHRRSSQETSELINSQPVSQHNTHRKGGGKKKEGDAGITDEVNRQSFQPEDAVRRGLLTRDAERRPRGPGLEAGGGGGGGPRGGGGGGGPEGRGSEERARGGGGGHGSWAVAKVGEKGGPLESSLFGVLGVWGWGFCLQRLSYFFSYLFIYFRSSNFFFSIQNGPAKFF